MAKTFHFYANFNSKLQTDALQLKIETGSLQWSKKLCLTFVTNILKLVNQMKDLLAFSLPLDLLQIKAMPGAILIDLQSSFYLMIYGHQGQRLAQDLIQFF